MRKYRSLETIQGIYKSAKPQNANITGSLQLLTS